MRYAGGPLIKVRRAAKTIPLIGGGRGGRKEAKSLIFDCRVFGSSAGARWRRIGMPTDREPCPRWIKTPCPGSMLILAALAAGILSRVALAADLYSPGNQRFIATGHMIDHRWFHTATLLSDGRVLIAGGHDGNGHIVDTAELYNPATTNFIDIVGSMTAHRQDHAATLLHDGRVLVTGGMDKGGILSSAEIYDPRRDSFAPAGNMTESRKNHTTTLLPDGRVLLAGGQNEKGIILRTAEIYDPATGKFSKTHRMRVARSGHVATLLRDGKVLLAGGVGRNRQVLSSAELYDPATLTFVKIRSMIEKREEFTATLLNNGQVLVAGGHNDRDEIVATAELYDPATRKFSFTASPMIISRSSHAASILEDGRVLIAGGVDYEYGGGLDSAELYDTASRTFTPVNGAMNAIRIFASATLLQNGQVLVAGGCAGKIGQPKITSLINPP